MGKETKRRKRLSIQRRGKAVPIEWIPSSQIRRNKRRGKGRPRALGILGYSVRRVPMKNNENGASITQGVKGGETKKKIFKTEQIGGIMSLAQVT